MFNNFSYRIAGVTSVPKYLYEELRKDGGPKSEEYMEQYKNYLNRDFKSLIFIKIFNCLNILIVSW